MPEQRETPYTYAEITNRNSRPDSRCYSTGPVQKSTQVTQRPQTQNIRKVERKTAIENEGNRKQTSQGKEAKTETRKIKYINLEKLRQNKQTENRQTAQSHEKPLRKNTQLQEANQQAVIEKKTELENHGMVQKLSLQTHVLFVSMRDIIQVPVHYFRTKTENGRQTYKKGSKNLNTNSLQVTRTKCKETHKRLHKQKRTLEHKLKIETQK